MESGIIQMDPLFEIVFYSALTLSAGSTYT
jgi:hypothetical protein